MFPFNPAIPSNSKKHLDGLVPSFETQPNPFPTIGRNANPKKQFPPIAKKFIEHDFTNTPYSHHITPNFNLKCGLCGYFRKNTRALCDDELL